MLKQVYISPAAHNLLKLLCGITCKSITSTLDELITENIGTYLDRASQKEQDAIDRSEKILVTLQNIKVSGTQNSSGATTIPSA